MIGHSIGDNVALYETDSLAELNGIYSMQDILSVHHLILDCKCISRKWTTIYMCCNAQVGVIVFISAFINTWYWITVLGTID